MNVVTPRQLNKQELAADLSLEPIDQSKRAFEVRPPPVSREQLDAMDELRAAAQQSTVYLGKEYAGKFLKAHGVAQS
jgi:hypothetical protein